MFRFESCAYESHGQIFAPRYTDTGSTLRTLFLEIFGRVAARKDQLSCGELPEFFIDCLPMLTNSWINYH